MIRLSRHNDILFFILLALPVMAQGQLIMRPIASPLEVSVESVSANISKNRRSVDLENSISDIPFWDDFSRSRLQVDSLQYWNNDTVPLWDMKYSQNVYVNATQAVNPPTYNVVTFDGLDKNGNYIKRENNAQGLTDELVSTNINLQNRFPSENLYLSFYWQGGGNVEKPDRRDSLVLHFLDQDSTWKSIWGVTGKDIISTNTFKYEIIRIPNSFLSKNFRFRFQAYGDQNGSFDAWHLDWIYLDKNRNPAKDISKGFLDRAFTGELSSPFTPFSSMPVDQFQAQNKFLRNQIILVSNLDRKSIHPIEIEYNLVNTLDNTVLVSDKNRAYNILLPNSIDTVRLLDADVNPISLKTVDFSSVLGMDSVVLSTEVILKSNDTILENTRFINLQRNDTIKTFYLLHDYYAYDDGSAEYAAGTNVRNGQVAVKYWLEKQDTLTHIDINFPNIAPIQVSSPRLELSIYKNLDDKSPLRLRQVLVENNTSRNSFTRYEIPVPLVISDTFFIVYKQFINDYIGIGLDRSNPIAGRYIYENFDGNWFKNTTIKGALMIRPIFVKNIPFLASITPSKSIKKRLKVYPNPVEFTFRILGEYEKLKIIDLRGNPVSFYERLESYDISHLKKGVYLLKVTTSTSVETHKIIIR